MPSLNINRHVNKHMSQIEPKSKDLATKVFEKTSFQLGWILVLASFFIFVGLPIQRFLVVLWVRGNDAYFHQGIRILKGKPVKFQMGNLFPAFQTLSLDWECSY